MSVLLSATELARCYREFWSECYDCKPPDYLSESAAFPPFLCRSLTFGHPQLPPNCSWELAMCGDAKGVVRRLGSNGSGPYWGVSGLSPLLPTIIPMNGHAVAVPSAERSVWLSQAIERIEAFGGDILDSVRSFVGMVVWLESPSVSGPTLTSSSFPVLPHCAFFTDAAARELLPNTTLPQPSPWALAENLYHESLHQQLSSTLLFADAFPDDYDSSSSPTVEVNWRNARWPLDRALHALFVYSRLLPMRIAHRNHAAVSSQEREAIERSMSEAVDAVRYLAAQVGEHASCFTDDGRKLLAQIHQEALQACESATASVAS